MSARAVRAGLFEERDGAIHLLGDRCRTCGRHQFPQADTCTLCGAHDPEPVPLSATGVLWGWTWVTAAPPGYAGPVPYGFGAVELPEGIRVITRLVLDPADEPWTGMPMRATTAVVGTDEDGTEVHSWAFAPSGEVAP